MKLKVLPQNHLNRMGEVLTDLLSRGRLNIDFHGFIKNNIHILIKTLQEFSCKKCSDQVDDYR